MVVPAFAFVGSGCLLVLELVAARLIAPTLGVSLYTWTSVIGVVLGGVSLGNFIGGRLADRRPRPTTLGAIYLVAAGLVLLVLAVLPEVRSLELPNSAPALLQVLWITAALFLLPSVALGTPTPVLTRLSLDALDHTGRVVGRIQGAAALGSIVGTFATGFFLITWFGTRDIVAGVAAILVVLAALAGLPWVLGRAAVVVVPLALVATVAAGFASHSPCTKESAYYCIRVSPGVLHFTGASGQRITYEPPVQNLYLDHLLHSVIDIKDPTHLEYDYELLYSRVVKKLDPPGSAIDSFVIGGGGYSFPRWLDKEYRGETTVAEIDPAVTAIARQQLAFKPSPRIDVRTGDARVILQDTPDSSQFDAIFGDAVDDYEVPFQLTTREFDRVVMAHLKPEGIYLLNLIDGVHYDFLRSEIRTLRTTFPYVGLMALSGDWPPHGPRDTYVIVAAKQAPSKALPVVSAGSLDSFVENGHSVVLTDDHAPVDQLLAPVFEQELHDSGEG